MFDIPAFAQGFALGLGMFVCPGPKDILILRQALARRFAAELVAVGVVSDALLIGLGMAGVSAALGRAPALQNAALWLGIGLMVGHGLLAARRSVIGAADTVAWAREGQPPPRGKGLAAVVTVSILNPAAWLDTVLVIGSTGAALPRPTQMSFGCGAVLASFTWFLALVAGARFAGRWMTARRTWQALDAFVAVAMIGLAAWLACSLPSR